MAFELYLFYSSSYSSFSSSKITHTHSLTHTFFLSTRLGSKVHCWHELSVWMIQLMMLPVVCFAAKVQRTVWANEPFITHIALLPTINYKRKWHIPFIIWAFYVVLLIYRRGYIIILSRISLRRRQVNRANFRGIFKDCVFSGLSSSG